MVTITTQEANAFLPDSLEWTSSTTDTRSVYLAISGNILNAKYILENKDSHRMAIARYACFLLSAGDDPGITTSQGIGGMSSTYKVDNSDLPLIVRSLLSDAKQAKSVLRAPNLYE